MRKIELSAAHSGRRLAAAVLLLAVGVAALVYAFTGLFAAGSGWQNIEVSSSAGASCGEDFTLLYGLGDAGVSASAEKKGLVRAYSDAAARAYQLFTSDAAAENVHNVWYLNQHPNEAVDVDPALYEALERVQAAGDRALYLGPVYEAYDGLFSCADDAQTADFDPRQNKALRAYFAQCAAFAADPAAVDVELLGEGRVRLAVSEEYLAFARENEIGRFLDFYWMKNAFIIDFLAEELTAAGYTNGALSSFDGFVRNLYSGEEAFGLDLYDRGTRAGALTYTGPMSFVCLRDYPLSESARQYFYTFSDGRVQTAYLDPADGRDRAAADDLTLCARDMGCGELLLKVRPVYTAEALDEGTLGALAADGVSCLFCRDGAILLRGPDMTVEPAEGYTLYNEP